MGLRREAELGFSLLPALPAAAPRGGRRRRPWTAPALNAVGALPARCPERLPAALPEKRGERGVGRLSGKKRKGKGEGGKKGETTSQIFLPKASVSTSSKHGTNLASPPPAAAAAKAAVEGWRHGARDGRGGAGTLLRYK